MLLRTTLGVLKLSSYPLFQDEAQALVISLKLARGSLRDQEEGLLSWPLKDSLA
jgi:hypothetical protein